jgi:membrane associated rhomboid family serine protease
MGIYERDYYQGNRQPGVHLGSEWTVVGKLIAINAAVFIIMSLRIAPQLSDWMAASSLSLSEPSKIWQLLTYGFAHDVSNAGHVIFNMFGLFVFGRDVESKYGSKEFLRFYLVSIVLGGLLFAARGLVLQTSGGVIGASGAVAAVVILFCVNFPKRTLLLMFVFPVPAWAIGMLLIVSNLFGAGWMTDQPVAYDVHLVGAGFALLYYRFGWNLGRWTPNLSGGKKWLKPKSKLKIHEPTGEDPYRSLDSQADELLAKVKREGVESLSDGEKRLLEDYSRRMRQKHS